MKNIFLNLKGLIFFIFLTIAITGSGQVTFNAASTTSGTYVSSINWQHTCTGTDRLLVVSVSTYDAADSVSSVTYNGIALTKKISAANTDLKWYRAEQWYLVNPPSNSNFPVIVTGSNQINYFYATATSYTGVNQTTPTGNSNKASGNSTAPLVAVNCGTNNMIVDVVSAARLINDCVLPQIRRGYITTGGTLNHAVSTEPGTGSVTMDWTLATSGYWAIAAMEINASSVSTNMTYISSTVTQNTVLSVNAGSTQQEIIGIQVVTNGSLNPLSATSFSLNTTGTQGTNNPTTNISNARLYYTGTSAGYATTNPIGAVVAGPNGVFTFTPSQVLANGTNYFWLSYDINAGAINGEYVDASCSSITVGGTARTPTTQSPTGSRQIVGNMQYVSSTVTQNTTNVYTGTTNQDVIGIQVVTTGAMNPISATTFDLTTLGIPGTNNPGTDIVNARLFYTGTTPTFSTTTQVGTPVALPNGAFSINAARTLASGTNYFWLTYDVNTTATVGNYIDASCNSINVGGTARTPTTTNPAGGRQITIGNNMIFQSCNVTQASTADVSQGSPNQQILRIEVVTTGTLSPLSLTSIQLRTSGSNNPVNDILNARIYYTGASATFATTSQLGVYNNPPIAANNYSISGSQVLATGANYFWLAYDIDNAAIAGNVVDGLCNQITVGGSNYVPSPTTDPTGNRKIVDNDIIYTCSYTFYDSGGAGGNYGNNEADTTTFCSTNGESIQLTFTQFSTEQGNDELFVYDGSSVTSPFLMVMSGDYISAITGMFLQPRVNSSGQCITLKFISNAATVKAGWAANVECVPFCGNKKLAKDPCGSATPICDLDGYCGNTSGTYTVDKPGNMCDQCGLFGGVIHNNSWLQFRAKSANVTLSVDVNSCTQGNGIQFGVYEGNACDGFVLKSPPEYVSGTGGNMAANQVTTISLTGLTPGQTYYIMVDGNFGDVCNYTITSNDFLTPDAGPNQFICKGDTVQMNAIGGMNYTWTPASTLTNANISNPKAFPTQTTKYTVEFTGTECIVTDTVTVNVWNKPTANITPDPASVCLSNKQVFNGNPTAGSGTITTHKWTGTGSTYLNNTNIQAPEYTATASGNYNLTYRVTDNNGCFVTDNVQVAVHEMTTNFNVSTPKCWNDSVTVTYTGNGSTSATFNWTFAGGSPSLATGIGPHKVKYTEGSTNTITLNSVNEFGCTSATPTSKNLIMPDSLYGTISAVNVLCYGDASGTADLTVHGGTANFTYLWSNSAITQDISGLTNGTYSVLITDKNGCKSNSSVVISQPSAALSASVASTNLSCYQNNTGKIDLSVSGGTPLYTYQWSNGPTTQNLSGLAIGTYSVIVTDLNGCTKTTSVTITQPVALTLSSISSNLKCFEDNTGSVNLTVNGGTNPYGYNWSNSSNSQDISGLSAGNYTVTVTDNKGCSNTLSASVSQPSQITSIINQINLACNGDNSGSVDLTVNGGTPSYTYKWSNNAATQDISGLAAGSYFVTITDNNACKIYNNINITQPNVLSATTNGVSVLCNGGTNGTATTSPSGGTSPYTFLWDDPSLQTTQTATGLTAGTYHVVVTDNHSCTYTATYTVTQPNALALNTNFTNATCGASNGVASVTVNEGTPPYSYQWSNGGTNSNIINIPAGSYTVTVTDKNGCSKSATADVGNDGAPDAQINTFSNVSCYGLSNGSATVTATGGTPTYTYSWSHGPTTQTVTGLSAGTYSVYVIDSKGCNDPVSIIITQPPVLSTNIQSTNISCNGLGNGTINMTANGGTPAYAYNWSNSVTTEDQSNIGPAKYYITVTDQNSCSKIDSVTLTQPGAMVSLITKSNLKCNKDFTGSANLSVSSGTSPYQFIWSNGEIAEDLNNLPAGKYIVTITDNKDCIKKDSVTITEPDTLVTTVAGNDLQCYNDLTGMVNLSVTGGTTVYSFKWSNGATTEDLNNINAGSYIVTVTDANNCKSISNMNILQPEKFLATVQSKNLNCNSDNSGSINLTVSGGTMPYNFLWSNTSTVEDLNNIPASTYYITITDDHNCTIIDTILISQPDGLITAIIGKNLFCNKDNSGSLNMTVTEGTKPYNFIWSNGEISEDMNYLSSGEYFVTITDANNCSKIDSVTITQPDSLVSSIAGKNLTCHNDYSGEADITVTGGTSPFSFSWTNGVTTEDLTGLPTGTYSVVVSDVHKCKTFSSITILQPDTITTAMISINLNCFNDSTGAAAVIPDGGKASYTFLWSNSETVDNINNLLPGKYKVTVTDMNLCSVVDSVTITQPDSINSILTPTDVLCHGYTGEVKLNIIGGSAPFKFIWSDEKTEQNIYNVPSGIYSVTITDKNGCSKVNSVEISEPDTVILNMTTSSVLCFGDSTGGIDLSVIGGVTPYTYNWSTGAKTEDISGASAGTYHVTVTDAHKCKSYLSSNITEPFPLMSIVFGYDAKCYGDNSGFAKLTVLYGTPPYTYLWAHGSTAEDPLDFPAGKFYVTISDHNSCTLIDSITINQPDSIRIDSTKSFDAKCWGTNTGTIKVYTSGGTPPFKYSIPSSVQQSIGEFNNLAAGNYTVTITDYYGCSKTVSLSIGQPQPIIITLGIVFDAYCGKNDGWATVSATNGIPPYTYQWNDPQNQYNDTAFNLKGNQYYTVTVTDFNQCKMVMNSIYVGNHPAGIAQIIDTNFVSCYNGSDGSAEVGMNGGTPPFKYQWDDDYFQTTAKAENLIAGPYSVTVTDNNGCSSIANITIMQPTPLIATIPPASITAAKCYGDSTGTASVVVSGGTPLYNYLWTGGGTNTMQDSLSAGFYTVTVSDSKGCISTATVEITQPDTSLLIDIKNVEKTCANDANGLVEVNAYGGEIGNGYLYKWSNGQMTKIISGLSQGSYMVTVTDANGCKAFETVAVTEYAPIMFNDTVIPTSCNASKDGKIKIKIISTETPYTFNWKEDISNNTDSIVELPANSTYTVTITDGNSCTTTKTYISTKTDIPCIDIPNGFTPNGDEWNNTWEIKNIDLYGNIKINVFNRWGELVFNFEGSGAAYSDEKKQWNGVNSFTGAEMPLGSYIYIIEIDEYDPYQGIVTIIR